MSNTRLSVFALIAVAFLVTGATSKSPFLSLVIVLLCCAVMLTGLAKRSSDKVARGEIVKKYGLTPLQAHLVFHDPDVLRHWQTARKLTAAKERDVFQLDYSSRIVDSVVRSVKIAPNFISDIQQAKGMLDRCLNGTDRSHDEAVLIRTATRLGLALTDIEQPYYDERAFGSETGDDAG